MTLEDVKNWVKTFMGAEASISVGSIDASKANCIGVYQNKRYSDTLPTPIGGECMRSYGQRHVVLLVHWTESPVECERKAAELYAQLQARPRPEIGGKTSFISASEPIGVGKDEKGICEYVVEFLITYNK